MSAPRRSRATAPWPGSSPSAHLPTPRPSARLEIASAEINAWIHSTQHGVIVGASVVVGAGLRDLARTARGRRPSGSLSARPGSSSPPPRCSRACIPCAMGCSLLGGAVIGVALRDALLARGGDRCRFVARNPQFALEGIRARALHTRLTGPLDRHGSSAGSEGSRAAPPGRPQPSSRARCWNSAPAPAKRIDPP